MVSLLSSPFIKLMYRPSPSIGLRRRIRNLPRLYQQPVIEPTPSAAAQAGIGTKRGERSKGQTGAILMDRHRPSMAWNNTQWSRSVGMTRKPTVAGGEKDFLQKRNGNARHVVMAIEYIRGAMNRRETEPIIGLPTEAMNVAVLTQETDIFLQLL